MAYFRPSVSSGSVSQMSFAAEHRPGDTEGGDMFWGAYEKAVALEGAKVGDYSATTMNGTLTFTGLFAAVVAGFLIKSVDMLSPDTGAQTVQLLSVLTSTMAPNNTLPNAVPRQSFADVVPAANGTTAPTFKASDAAIIINSLWFVGLLITLACGLLATMVQEWTQRFLRGQVRLVHESRHRYALELMSSQMAAERWYLDRAASAVVGLMHVAIVIFIFGIDVYVYSMHPKPAIASAVCTGLIAFIYLGLSSIPLFQEACPYSTPLTDLLTFIIVIPISALSCLITYCLILIWVIRYKATRGLLKPAHQQLLKPTRWLPFLVNPLFTTMMVHACMDYLARLRAGEMVYLAQHIMDTLFDLEDPGVEESNEVDFNKAQMEHLWEHVGLFSLENPPAMHHFAHDIAKGDNSQSDSLLAGFRHDSSYMSRIAAAIRLPISSTYAATGWLRFLQMLFQASNPFDEHTSPALREERRWVLAGPILRAFRHFAEGVGSVNTEALQLDDTSVMEAVSSFRLTLLEMLSRTRVARAEPNARTRTLVLFQDLDRVESLRLKPLAANDAETAEDFEELFKLDEGLDISAQLALRNALTLIAAANTCGWRGSWHDPDKRYLPKNFPRTLHWFQSRVVGIHPQRKPPASGFFRAFLSEVGLDDWKQPGSKFLAPPGSPLPRAAIEALRDLALVVDLQEYDALSTPSYNAPNSPTLGNAEEGKAGSETSSARTTSMRFGTELIPRVRKGAEE